MRIHGGCNHGISFHCCFYRYSLLKRTSNPIKWVSNRTYSIGLAFVFVKVFVLNFAVILPTTVKHFKN